jgi:hypothetical protein
MSIDNIEFKTVFGDDQHSDCCIISRDGDRFHGSKYIFSRNSKVIASILIESVEDIPLSHSSIEIEYWMQAFHPFNKPPILIMKHIGTTMAMAFKYDMPLLLKQCVSQVKRGAMSVQIAKTVFEIPELRELEPFVISHISCGFFNSDYYDHVPGRIFGRVIKDLNIKISELRQVITEIEPLRATIVTLRAKIDKIEQPLGERKRPRAEDFFFDVLSRFLILKIFRYYKRNGNAFRRPHSRRKKCRAFVGNPETVGNPVQSSWDDRIGILRNSVGSHECG